MIIIFGAKIQIQKYNSNFPAKSQIFKLITVWIFPPRLLSFYNFGAKIQITYFFVKNQSKLQQLEFSRRKAQMRQK